MSVSVFLFLLSTLVWETFVQQTWPTLFIKLRAIRRYNEPEAEDLNPKP